MKTFFLSVGPKHLCSTNADLTQTTLMWFIESLILDQDNKLRFSCFYLIWMRRRRSDWADGEGKHIHHTQLHTVIRLIEGTELWLIVFLKMTLKCSSRASCSCREVHRGWGQTKTSTGLQEKRNWFSRSCWRALATQADSFRPKLLAELLEFIL